MRNTKRRSFFSRLSLQQLIFLEVLALFNILLIAGVGVLAFSDQLADLRFGQPGAAKVLKVGVEFKPLPTLFSLPTWPPAWTATPSPLPTRTFSSALAGAPSNTPTSVAPGLSATPAPTHPPPATAMPEQKVLLDVAGRPQTLPLSCEARSAVDWAAYFGLSIDELEFFSRLPLSDNPNVGFVGDVHGKWGQVPPNPYGVHAGPVAALLREYGLGAQARSDLTWEEVRAELDAGRPVIVWVVGHVWVRGKSIRYTAPDGETVLVAPYEHTVMLVGYETPSKVFFSDEGKLYSRSLDVFLKSWALLGNMAVMAAP